MKIIYKIILFILISISITFFSLFVFNKEFKFYILYNIYPQYAREANFLKLSKSDQLIYLLGTIHKRLKDNGRSLLHIEAAVENIKPDLLLVESRPEQLARDNWADGPIEMLFASLTARSLGIKVDGMDWHEDDPSKFGTTWKERDDRMFHNIRERIPGHPVVLILTGYSHIQEFKPRFQQIGYSIESFSRYEKRSLLDTSGKRLIFPPGMGYYVNKSIERARVHYEKIADEELKSVNKNYIVIMERFLRVIEEVGERQGH